MKLTFEGTAMKAGAYEFTKDWLYMNLQSDRGCTVNVYANFKRSQHIGSFNRTIGKETQRGGKMDFGATNPERSMMMASMASSQEKKPIVKKQEDLNSEVVDFSTWSLGNGKINDKRETLQAWLAQLMDRNNRKLRQQHDTYCKKIKRKRNR